MPIGDPLVREVPCPGGSRGGCFVGPPPRNENEDWERELRLRARACLESRVERLPQLGGPALERWTLELITACFAADGSREQDAQGGALPFRYAIHEGSGLPLELSYFCTDHCPNQGHVFARFVDVQESECRARGGVPAEDNGWSAYEGCLPRELAP